MKVMSLNSSGIQEYPFVRYRSAKALDATTMTTYRELIPTKLAASVWNCLARYKQTVEDFPQTETCELLILDRSIDQVGIFTEAIIFLFCLICHSHMITE